METYPASPASPREASLLPCKALRRIPRCPSQLERNPDVAEQTRVLKGNSQQNSRIYPRFMLKLEKNHETTPRCEMRPNSPALHGVQFHVPH